MSVKVKVPYKVALGMVDKGHMTKKGLEDGIKDGSIANPSATRGGKRVMLGNDGKTQITPTLYFSGVGALPYTTEMNELKDKFNTLKANYTQSVTEIQTK